MRKPLISHKTEWQETMARVRSVGLKSIEGKSTEVRLSILEAVGVQEGIGPLMRENRAFIDLSADDCRVLSDELSRAATRLSKETT